MLRMHREKLIFFKEKEMRLDTALELPRSKNRDDSTRAHLVLDYHLVLVPRVNAARCILSYL